MNPCLTSSATEQILAAYVDNHMSPEEIAAGFDNEYDIVAIKAILMQFCPEYKRSLKANKEALGFNESQEQLAINTIFNLSQYGEEESTRLKAAMYVREDARGRRDPARLSGLGINIGQFQIYLDKANAALQLTDSKRAAIDVQEVSQEKKAA